MTLITPNGNSNFSWAPKDGLTKTASTGAAELSDKDLLFDAAKKFVKAQAEKFEKEEKEDKPEEKEEKSEDKGEKSEDKGEKSDKPEKKDDKPCKPCDKKPEGSEVSVDVQKAVQELVEKSEKAEEIAQKVGDAVAKVEEAVQEVKEVAGVAGDSLPAGSLPADDAIGGLPEGEVGEVNEVELEIEDPSAIPGEAEAIDSIPGDASTESPVGPTGEELIKESLPGMGVLASDANDFVKLSAISPDTRKKVTTYWQDYLGFPSDYVKLMTKNYEK